MKKHIIAITIVLMAGLTIGVISYGLGVGWTRTSQLNDTSLSPKGTYKIALEGKRGEPAWPFVSPADLNNREVTINVFKNGKTLVENFNIYHGGAYDTDFALLYPEHRWLSDSIFQLGNRIDAVNQDEIVISNQTQQPISYLEVRAGKRNIFLLLDLAPRSSYKVAVHLQAPERDVGCTGRFQNGKQISYRYAGFSVEPHDVPLIHYCVVVNDSDVAIQSRSFREKVSREPQLQLVYVVYDANQTLLATFGSGASKLLHQDDI